MIRRTLDATQLNHVANDPAVRPWLGGDGPLDLTAIVSDPANVTYITDHGGFIGVSLGAGRYEIHSLFTVDGRGRETIRAMEACRDAAFVETDAVELVTKVPVDNEAADGLARLAGFSQQYRMPLPWDASGTRVMSVRAITIDQWAGLAHGLEPAGRDLHDQFAVLLAGTDRQHSEEDPTHLRWAGAAALMVRAGNAEKAVWFYDRWCQITGYPPFRIVRAHPLTLDLGGLVVAVNDGQMETICR